MLGAGPIGIMVALAALAGGCARVIVSDLAPPSSTSPRRYPGHHRRSTSGSRTLADEVSAATDDWGADVVFEASGTPEAFASRFDLRAARRLHRGGRHAGRAGGASTSSAAAAKEIRIETVFRYANVFDRAIALIASGKVDLKPLISATFPFEESIQAFERAAEGRPADVKLQVKL